MFIVKNIFDKKAFLRNIGTIRRLRNKLLVFIPRGYSLKIVLLPLLYIPVYSIVRNSENVRKKISAKQKI